VPDRMEPDELAGVVEDHRTALTRSRGRCDEHEAARRAAFALKHGYRRRVQVGARDEPLDVSVRCEPGEHVAKRGSSEEEAGSSGKQIPAGEGLQVREPYVRTSTASLASP